MQFFKYRISADDAEIFDAGARWSSLRAQNHPQGILLSGLPLYLDEPGRAYDRAALASILSGKRSRTRLIRFPNSLMAELPLRKSLAILSGLTPQLSERSRQGHVFDPKLTVRVPNNDQRRNFAAAKRTV
jgi:hypothetical protein